MQVVAARLGRRVVIVAVHVVPAAEVVVRLSGEVAVTRVVLVVAVLEVAGAVLEVVVARSRSSRNGARD